MFDYEFFEYFSYKNVHLCMIFNHLNTHFIFICVIIYALC
jgi:hypothetical protein